MTITPTALAPFVNPAAAPLAAQSLASQTAMIATPTTSHQMAFTAPTSRPGLFTRMCMGGSAFMFSGMGTAAAQTTASCKCPPATSAPAAPADAVQPDLLDHITSFPLQTVAHLGVIVGGAVILHKAIGRAIKALEPDQVSAWKPYARRGLRLTRTLIWGATAYLGYRILGLSHGEMLVGLGGTVALVALTARGFLTRIQSSFSVATRGDLEVGDWVEMWDGFGKVKRVTSSRVIMEYVDKHGAKHEISCPIETFAGRLSDESYPKKEFLRSLELGNYISFDGKMVGKIVSNDDLSIGIEQEDAAGNTYIHHIDVRKFTESSVVNYGMEIPPLPDKLIVGDKVEIGQKKGEIIRFNEWYLWLKGDQDVVHKIPRTDLQNAWSLIEKKPAETSDGETA